MHEEEQQLSEKFKKLEEKVNILDSNINILQKAISLNQRALTNTLDRLDALEDEKIKNKNEEISKMYG